MAARDRGEAVAVTRATVADLACTVLAVLILAAALTPIWLAAKVHP